MVWTEINGVQHTGQKDHHSSTQAFANNIMEFWRGFGADYGVNGSSHKMTVNPPAANGSGLTAPNDTYKAWVDDYYINYTAYNTEWTTRWPELKSSDSSVRILPEGYVFNNNRYTITNLDVNTHKFTSPVGSTIKQESHVHNGVVASASNVLDQCDLCGYRKGMPDSLSYSDFLSCNDVFQQSNPGKNGRTKVDVAGKGTVYFSRVTKVNGLFHVFECDFRYTGFTSSMGWPIHGSTAPYDHQGLALYHPAGGLACNKCYVKFRGIGNHSTESTPFVTFGNWDPSNMTGAGTSEYSTSWSSSWQILWGSDTSASYNFMQFAPYSGAPLQGNDAEFEIADMVIYW